MVRFVTLVALVPDSHWYKQLSPPTQIAHATWPGWKVVELPKVMLRPPSTQGIENSLKVVGSLSS